MLQRLDSLTAARPRRTLIVVCLFIALAGVVGGPLAGKLDSGGGFTTADAESTRAAEQLEAATGRESSPGVLLLVSGGAGGALEQRAQAVADRLGDVPGIAEVSPAGRSRDGGSMLVAGIIDARADDEDVDLVATARVHRSVLCYSATRTS